MAIYREAPNKLIVIVTNPNKTIDLTVDGLNGTIASVTFKNTKSNHITVSNGETKPIGTGAELKGKTIIFDGASGNPIGDPSIRHIFEEGDITKLIYNFPNHYTGQPPYDSEDKQPSYKFHVIFQ